MMDTNRVTASLSLDSKIEFSSRVTKAVSDVKHGEEAFREAMHLIHQTFCLASSERKAPKDTVTLFSVNIGEKGRVRLIRLKAVTILDIERKVISIDLPEAEWGGN